MQGEVYEQALLDEVNMVLVSFPGCTATEIGPRSVGVQGDARVYLPTVYVTFNPRLSPEEIREISTTIINKVAGISRVLMNIVIPS
jgi:GMP synthase PP-ATPase subunit